MSAMNKVVSNKGLGDRLYGAFLGRNSEKHAGKVREHIENGEYKEAAKNFGKIPLDLVTGADYKGEGMKRAGIVGLRAGTALGMGTAFDVGVRQIGGGDFTHNANGEKDIAGIPFI